MFAGFLSVWPKRGEVVFPCAGTVLDCVYHSAVYNKSSSNLGFNLPTGIECSVCIARNWLLVQPLHDMHGTHSINLRREVL